MSLCRKESRFYCPVSGSDVVTHVSRAATCADKMHVLAGRKRIADAVPSPPEWRPPAGTEKGLEKHVLKTQSVRLPNRGGRVRVLKRPLLRAGSALCQGLCSLKRFFLICSWAPAALILEQLQAQGVVESAKYPFPSSPRVSLLRALRPEPSVLPGGGDLPPHRQSDLTSGTRLLHVGLYKLL